MTEPTGRRIPNAPLAAACLLSGLAAFLSFVCGAEVLGWILTVVCVATAIWWLSPGDARRG
ncbi:hypothetical protein GA0070616_4364 [Micromonospora nigra]|uniref:Uncharacterized protein n=1 Tax=Micromonospora nigra TaxID=145857 RepID=A0A1C6SRK9_9ACTN|nr:hypothetical protein [Micromonospora nigra]SCL31959.1 hypothetical protein GA0070616_4364 [Micromonospora nigra]